MKLIARNDKLPKELGLPRAMDEPLSWLNALTSRLYILIKMCFDDVNLLIDGYVLNVAGLPAANSTTRGRMVILRGSAGVTDILYVCMKSAADTYSWVQIVTGG